MNARERPFKAVVRHPITHRQITIRARTERELEGYLGKIERMREDRKIDEPDDSDDERVSKMRGGKILLKDAAADYVARPDISKNTRDNTETFMRAYADGIAERDVFQLDGRALTRWLEGLYAKDLAPSTIDFAWLKLRALIRYQIQTGRMSREPWGSFRPKIPGARHAANPRDAARDVGELLAILDAARQLDERYRARGAISYDEAVMSTAATLGRRQGELAGLRWPDLTGRGTVRILRQWDGAEPRRPTKARRILELAADEAFFALLEQHRGYLESVELYDPEGPIFPSLVYSTPGHPRHRQHGEHPIPPERFRAAVRLAGLPDPERWSAQSLRDSFCTFEARAKAGDLVATAERTGHLSITGLVRYLRSRTRGPAPPGFTLGGRPAPPALPSGK